MSRRRPNIVWLLTDHHAFQHHVSLPGARPAMPTYELLGRGGVTFRQAQAVCPLCTPARASMVTGVYPHRHGMTENNGDMGSRLEFDPDTRLFSHCLVEAGYRVGYFGKWHCGIERIPKDYAFEGWSLPGYGYPYSQPEYAEYLDELGLPRLEAEVEWRFGTRELVGERVNLMTLERPLRLMEASGRLLAPAEAHEAFFVARLAERWLEDRAKDGDRFCLRVDVWGPHQPYLVGPPFSDTVDPRGLREYPTFRHDLTDRPQQHRDFRDRRHSRATVHSWQEWQPILARCYEHVALVDAAMGRVLGALDRLGLAGNTLVIYTADHGDAICSQGGVFDKDSLMAEETQRIPLALRWPGVLAPGSATDALVTNMDVVPTVLEAAGAELPDRCDGESLLAVARDPAGASWREDLMCQHHGHGTHTFQRLLRWGPYKYVAHLGDLDELYDLSRDPYEVRNRIDDPALGDVLKEMRARLARWMDRHEDDAPDARRLLEQMK